MGSTTKVSKNSKALYLILFVIFDLADFYVLLYTDISWLPNFAYSVMSWILVPAVVITVASIGVFLFNSSRRTDGLGNDAAATQTSSRGGFNFALQASLILVLVAAGFGLVWVGLIANALGHQTY